MNTKRFIAISGLLATAIALPIGGTAKASEFLAAQSVGGTTQSKLIVNIEGLSSNEGTVMVGLYDTKDDFKNKQELIGKTVSAKSREAQIIFESLPVGDYALKVFHDENDNGELDINSLGMPSESYGFSNNASDPFSAPEWSETRFSLPRGRMTQTIDLG